MELMAKQAHESEPCQRLKDFKKNIQIAKIFNAAAVYVDFDNSKMPCVKLSKSDCKICENLIKAIDTPRKASIQSILKMFNNIIGFNIQIANQSDFSHELMLENMAKFLSEFLSADALPFIQKEIISNQIFFPAPAIFLKTQEGYIAYLRRVRIIAVKSLNFASDNKIEAVTVKNATQQELSQIPKPPQQKK